MHQTKSRRPRAPALRAVLLACLAAAGAAAVHAAEAPVAVVPEMERPPGISAGRRAELRALADSAEGEQGLAAFRERIRREWPALRELDLVAMSRFHVEATRGWRLPAQPGELAGRTIGREADGSALFLELRGPRLPASFDIVHRHLTFYARYRPADGTLDRVTATIRLEVFE